MNENSGGFLIKDTSLRPNCWTSGSPVTEAGRIQHRPLPSSSPKFQSCRWFFTSEIAAGCSLQLLPPLEELHPLSVPPSALCSDSSSQLYCTPSVAKKWGCSEVRAHFLFHLSACEIDFSHVGFKVEGRIFKSTFLPLQVQEKKNRWGQTDRQEHVSLCQVVLLFVKR